MNRKANIQPLITLVSQIFEDQKDDAGNGLLGFTVQYTLDKVENHVKAYSTDTRLIVLSEIQAEHQVYVDAIAQS